LLWIKTGIIVVGTDIFLIWATLLSLWQRDEYWRERGKDPKHALSAVTRWLWKNSLRCWSTLAIHMSTTTQRWPRVLPSPARRQSCTQVPEGDQHIKLAELRIRLRDEQSLEEAADLLVFAARGPVFPRHKTVGIVHADQLTLKRLEKLAK
jgi:hypothetical protein